MEFDKSRVYTALNADELKQGDKVILANTMANLREDVRKGINIECLRDVHGEDCLSRFIGKEGWFPLAYLYERAENCCSTCRHPYPECPVAIYEPKTEPKAEKKYRPFKDTDELIKVWDAKIGTPNWGTDGDLTMPHIWVRMKSEEYDRGRLITSCTRTTIELDDDVFTVDYLLNNYTFLDGSPCGVEE